MRVLPRGVRGGFGVQPVCISSTRRFIFLENYMFDMEWLHSVCPQMFTARDGGVIVHGDDPETAKVACAAAAPSALSEFCVAWAISGKCRPGTRWLQLSKGEIVEIGACVLRDSHVVRVCGCVVCGFSRSCSHTVPITPK